MKNYECPLCGIDFEGATCHSSCPMSRGCDMVRCPRCGYEFVESGRILDMLRRFAPFVLGLFLLSPLALAGDMSVVPALKKAAEGKGQVQRSAGVARRAEDAHATPGRRMCNTWPGCATGSRRT